MPHKIDSKDAQRVLEAAWRRARASSTPTTAGERLWDPRVHLAWTWTTQLAAVAALGTALLAKATEPKIDPMSITAASGPDGYSARGLATRLAGWKGTYGYELGKDGPDPLAAQPFFKQTRIDRISNWRNPTAGAELVSWLTGLTQAEAEEGLVVFLRVGMEMARLKAASRAATVAVDAPVRTIEQLVEGLKILSGLGVEHGRLGAAATAAAFEAAGYRVEARDVHDPGQTDIDVFVGREKVPVWGVEVKQKLATANDAYDIAKGASDRGATKALLVALDPKQLSLGSNALSMVADVQIGVALKITNGFQEMFMHAIHSSPVARQEFLDSYVKHMSKWLTELGVSQVGRDRWKAMVTRWEADAAAEASD